MSPARRISFALVLSALIHGACLLFLPNLLPPPPLKIIPVTILAPMELLLKETPGGEMHPFLEEVSSEIWREVFSGPMVELPMGEPKPMELVEVEPFLAMAPLDVELRAPSLEPLSLPKPPPPEGVLEALEKALEERKRPEPKPIQIGIEGPVKARRLLYRPPLPRISVGVETEVVLKFWVRPDGTVGRILPLKKGNTQLELAGMDFLKGCLFEPLPEGSPPREEWGTLVVRSVLR